VRWALRLALGLEVGDIPVVSAPPIAFFRWIVSPIDATVVSRVEGMDAARNLEGVDDAILNRAVGDHVDSRESPFLNHVVRIDGWSTRTQISRSSLTNAFPQSFMSRGTDDAVVRLTSTAPDVTNDDSRRDGARARGFEPSVVK